MPRFIETREDDLGTTKLALHLRRGPGGDVLGRIVAMAVTHAGLTPETTAPDDPPIAEALRQVGDLARSMDTDVALVDPQGLWDASWGTLETHRSVEGAKPSEGDEVVAAGEPSPVTERKAEDLPDLGGVID